MADKKYYNFTSPIGRLVSGSPDSFKTTNQAGELLRYKSGQNIGQPKKEYAIGVAYRKDQSDVPAFMQLLRRNAAKEWPNLFDENMNCTYPAFADKIIDGDSTIMNKNQKRPCDKPEWKGCWVIWFTSDRAPRCVSHMASEYIEPSFIKCGYFVRVSGSMCKNSGDTPGMYMNLEGVELSGYGPEISNRPDPREAFKNSEPAAVPEGMSTTPVGQGEGPSDETPPPPPGPQHGEEAPRASGKVIYQGLTYERQQLIDTGWTEAQVAALPQA